MQCARAIDWRGTAVLLSVDGPSTRACFWITTWDLFLLPSEKITYALVINDLYNGGKLSIFRATVDEDNTSNLNESP